MGGVDAETQLKNVNCQNGLSFKSLHLISSIAEGVCINVLHLVIRVCSYLALHSVKIEKATRSFGGETSCVDQPSAVSKRPASPLPMVNLRYKST